MLPHAQWVHGHELVMDHNLFCVVPQVSSVVIIVVVVLVDHNPSVGMPSRYLVQFEES